MMLTVIALGATLTGCDDNSKANVKRDEEKTNGIMSLFKMMLWLKI